MISDKLKKAILTELKLDDFTIEDATMANQIPGWDSLNHINVITAIEKDYGLRFKAIEVLKCKNIGDLQKLIDSKQNK
ncbi:MAG: acyl carrier protein [Ignavibacteriaceae bacterium]|nr:acyl carrier protein [Ignavibacteriaceae bacterium]